MRTVDLSTALCANLLFWEFRVILHAPKKWALPPRRRDKRYLSVCGLRRKGVLGGIGPVYDNTSTTR